MQLATILEPLLIVAMGVVVMLIVLAVLLPIIQLNQFAKIEPMPVTLDDKLVVAISSRALFNLEEENRSSKPATPGLHAAAAGAAGRAGAARHRLLAGPEAAGLQRRRRRSAWRW